MIDSGSTALSITNEIMFGRVGPSLVMYCKTVRKMSSWLSTLTGMWMYWADSVCDMHSGITALSSALVLQQLPITSKSEFDEQDVECRADMYFSSLTF